MKRYAALIALLAMAALGAFAVAQETAAPAKPAEPAVKAPLARIQEDLNLTPEQKAKLEEFRKTRWAENKAYSEQMVKLREQMQALRKDGRPDPAKMNPLIDQMYKLQAEQAKAQLKHEIDREKIFTPEQLEKMQARRPGFGPMGPGLRAERMMGMRPGMMGPRPGRMMALRHPMRPGLREGMRLRMREGMRRGLRMRERLAPEMWEDFPEDELPINPPPEGRSPADL